MIRILLACALLSLALAAHAEDAPEAVAIENPRVALETSMGTIVVELDAVNAPISTENFLGYVRSGAYDGTIFHRVIDNFMIQGGGYEVGMIEREAGEPIRNEADNGLPNLRGTIAMARTGQPHSARNQFFINVVDNPRLNHVPGSGGEEPINWGYAVFGRVVEGMDVVDAIRAVPTGTFPPFFQDVPLQPVVLRRARVLDDSALDPSQETASPAEPAGPSDD